MVDPNLEDITEHLDFIKKVCMMVEAELILELGVRSGNSTRAFLEVADKLDANVISIDIDDCSCVANSPRWKFYQMDDLNFNQHLLIDVLFIDTSHTYEQTLKELEKFEPMVKRGGVIFLHDTISKPEVLEAIKTYLHTNSHLRFENRAFNNGLGVIWK
jgi:predicted O-methyltransferase YrrM